MLETILQMPIPSVEVNDTDVLTLIGCRTIPTTGCLIDSEMSETKWL